MLYSSECVCFFGFDGRSRDFFLRLALSANKKPERWVGGGEGGGPCKVRIPLSESELDEGEGEGGE